MKLNEELGLTRGITDLAHEAVLNVYLTSSQIKKRVDEFFKDYGLTDVQFNLMMLVKYQSGAAEGLAQVALSRMMLVNRANITSLVDRMEKARLVKRTPDPDDRRYHIVRLTAHGRKKLDGVQDAYYEMIHEVMDVLKDSELRSIIKRMEKLRDNIG
ncbi:MarR family winged helix-turn-helix transcriptional regulator [Candidatus Sumerlaeota bacterium]